MKRKDEVLTSSVRFKVLCIHMRIHSMRKTGEWHPHIHMFALVDQWIDQQEFSEYWHSVTGDSMVVDVRRAKREKGHGYSKAAAEVCKYALKFGDLSVEKTWEAFKVLKGKRLTGSFGLLWGVKIPDTMTDDMPEEDLPYLEMLYKFTYGKKSYYDLLITRHVEAQAGERAELGGATTTPDEDIARVLQVLNKVRNGAWRPRVEQRSVLYRSFNVKKPTGESHLLPVFVFGKESEDGTGLCITLIFSHMSNIGY